MKTNKIVKPTKHEKELFGNKKPENDGRLKGPDSKSIPKHLCIKIDDKEFPYRVINTDMLNVDNCKLRDMAVLVQSTDQFNIIMLCFLALAKDVYSRNPNGTLEFYKICEQMQMNILDADRNSTDIAKELKKVLGI